MERKRRMDARGYKRRARRENWIVQQQRTEGRKGKDGWKESDGRMRVATKGEAKEERMGRTPLARTRTERTGIEWAKKGEEERKLDARRPSGAGVNGKKRQKPPEKRDGTRTSDSK